MLIGQIEQEILEGRFWNVWLKSYPDYFTSPNPIDLQPDQSTTQNHQMSKRKLPFGRSVDQPF